MPESRYFRKLDVIQVKIEEVNVHHKPPVAKGRELQTGGILDIDITNSETTPRVGEFWWIERQAGRWKLRNEARGSGTKEERGGRIGKGDIELGFLVTEKKKALEYQAYADFKAIHETETGSEDKSDAYVIEWAPCDKYGSILPHHKSQQLFWSPGDETIDEPDDYDLPDSNNRHYAILPGKIPNPKKWYWKARYRGTVQGKHGKWSDWSDPALPVNTGNPIPPVPEIDLKFKIKECRNHPDYSGVVTFRDVGWWDIPDYDAEDDVKSYEVQLEPLLPIYQVSNDGDTDYKKLKLPKGLQTRPIQGNDYDPSEFDVIYDNKIYRRLNPKDHPRKRRTLKDKDEDDNPWSALGPLTQDAPFPDEHIYVDEVDFEWPITEDIDDELGYGLNGPDGDFIIRLRNPNYDPNEPIPFAKYEDMYVKVRDRDDAYVKSDGITPNELNSVYHYEVARAYWGPNGESSGDNHTSTAPVEIYYPEHRYRAQFSGIQRPDDIYWHARVRTEDRFNRKSAWGKWTAPVLPVQDDNWLLPAPTGVALDFDRVHRDRHRKWRAKATWNEVRHIETECHNGKKNHVTHYNAQLASSDGTILVGPVTQPPNQAEKQVLTITGGYEINELQVITMPLAHSGKFTLNWIEHDTDEIDFDIDPYILAYNMQTALIDKFPFLDGNIAVTPANAVSEASWAAGEITATTILPHGLSVGDDVKIYDVLDENGLLSGYNGTYSDSNPIPDGVSEVVNDFTFKVPKAEDPAVADALLIIAEEVNTGNNYNVFTVEWLDSYSGTNISLITGDGSNLLAWPDVPTDIESYVHVNGNRSSFYLTFNDGNYEGTALNIVDASWAAVDDSGEITFTVDTFTYDVNEQGPDYNLNEGDFIVVTDVRTTSNKANGYNGNFIVTSRDKPNNTFTVECVANPGTYGSGGKVHGEANIEDTEYMSFNSTAEFIQEELEATSLINPGDITVTLTSDTGEDLARVRTFDIDFLDTGRYGGHVVPTIEPHINNTRYEFAVEAESITHGYGTYMEVLTPHEPPKTQEELDNGEVFHVHITKPAIIDEVPPAYEVFKVTDWEDTGKNEIMSLTVDEVTPATTFTIYYKKYESGEGKNLDAEVRSATIAWDATLEEYQDAFDKLFQEDNQVGKNVEITKITGPEAGGAFEYDPPGSNNYYHLYKIEFVGDNAATDMQKKGLLYFNNNYYSYLDPEYELGAPSVVNPFLYFAGDARGTLPDFNSITDEWTVQHGGTKYYYVTRAQKGTDNAGPLFDSDGYYDIEKDAEIDHLYLFDWPYFHKRVSADQDKDKDNRAKAVFEQNIHKHRRYQARVRYFDAYSRKSDWSVWEPIEGATPDDGKAPPPPTITEAYVTDHGTDVHVEWEGPYDPNDADMMWPDFDHYQVQLWEGKPKSDGGSGKLLKFIKYTLRNQTTLKTKKRFDPKRPFTVRVAAVDWSGNRSIWATANNLQPERPQGPTGSRLRFKKHKPNKQHRPIVDSVLTWDEYKSSYFDLDYYQAHLQSGEVLGQVASVDGRDAFGYDQDRDQWWVDMIVQNPAAALTPETYPPPVKIETLDVLSVNKASPPSGYRIKYTLTNNFAADSLFKVGAKVTISGATPSGYNRTSTITRVTANSFTVFSKTNPGSVPVCSANEVVDIVSANGSTGENFKLTFGAQTTIDIAYDATAATVQSALESLPTIEVGNVLVTRSGSVGSYTWRVTFVRELGATNVGAITHTPGTVPGDLTITPSVITAGFGGIVKATVTNGNPFSITFSDHFYNSFNEMLEVAPGPDPVTQPAVEPISLVGLDPYTDIVPLPEDIPLQGWSPTVVTYWLSRSEYPNNDAVLTDNLETALPFSTEEVGLSSGSYSFAPATQFTIVPRGVEDGPFITPDAVIPRGDTAATYRDGVMYLLILASQPDGATISTVTGPDDLPSLYKDEDKVERIVAEVEVSEDQVEWQELPISGVDNRILVDMGMALPDDKVQLTAFYAIVEEGKDLDNGLTEPITVKFSGTQNRLFTQIIRVNGADLDSVTPILKTVAGSTNGIATFAQRTSLIDDIAATKAVTPPTINGAGHEYYITYTFDTPQPYYSPPTGLESSAFLIGDVVSIYGFSTVNSQYNKQNVKVSDITPGVGDTIDAIQVGPFHSAPPVFDNSPTDTGVIVNQHIDRTDTLVDDVYREGRSVGIFVSKFPMDLANSSPGHALFVDDPLEGVDIYGPFWMQSWGGDRGSDGAYAVDLSPDREEADDYRTPWAWIVLGFTPAWKRIDYDLGDIAYFNISERKMHVRNTDRDKNNWNRAIFEKTDRTKMQRARVAAVSKRFHSAEWSRWTPWANPNDKTPPPAPLAVWGDVDHKRLHVRWSAKQDVNFASQVLNLTEFIDADLPTFKLVVEYKGIEYESGLIATEVTDAATAINIEDELNAIVLDDGETLGATCEIFGVEGSKTFIVHFDNPDIVELMEVEEEEDGFISVYWPSEIETLADVGTLADDIDDVVSSITVTEPTTLNDGLTVPFSIQIDNEEMLVTNRVVAAGQTYTYTVERGINSTVPEAHDIGSAVTGNDTEPIDDNDTSYYQIRIRDARTKRVIKGMVDRYVNGTSKTFRIRHKNKRQSRIKYYIAEVRAIDAAGNASKWVKAKIARSGVPTPTAVSVTFGVRDDKELPYYAIANWYSPEDENDEIKDYEVQAQQASFTRLKQALTDISTTVKVMSSKDIPKLKNGNNRPFKAWIGDEEISIAANAASAHTWTVTRAQGGTTAKAHKKGEKVYFFSRKSKIIDKKHIADFYEGGIEIIDASYDDGTNTVTYITDTNPNMVVGDEVSIVQAVPKGWNFANRTITACDTESFSFTITNGEETDHKLNSKKYNKGGRVWDDAKDPDGDAPPGDTPSRLQSAAICPAKKGFYYRVRVRAFEKGGKMGAFTQWCTPKAAIDANVPSIYVEPPTNVHIKTRRGQQIVHWNYDEDELKSVDHFDVHLYKEAIAQADLATWTTDDDALWKKFNEISGATWGVAVTKVARDANGIVTVTANAHGFLAGTVDGDGVMTNVNSNVRIDGIEGDHADINGEYGVITVTTNTFTIHSPGLEFAEVTLGSGEPVVSEIGKPRIRFAIDANLTKPVPFEAWATAKKNLIVQVEGMDPEAYNGTYSVIAYDTINTPPEWFDVNASEDRPESYVATGTDRVTFYNTRASLEHKRTNSLRAVFERKHPKHRRDDDNIKKPRWFAIVRAVSKTGESSIWVENKQGGASYLPAVTGLDLDVDQHSQHVEWDDIEEEVDSLKLDNPIAVSYTEGGGEGTIILHTPDNIPVSWRVIDSIPERYVDVIGIEEDFFNDTWQIADIVPGAGPNIIELVPFNLTDYPDAPDEDDYGPSDVDGDTAQVLLSNDGEDELGYYLVELFKDNTDPMNQAVDQDVWWAIDSAGEKHIDHTAFYQSVTSQSKTIAASGDFTFTVVATTAWHEGDEITIRNTESPKKYWMVGNIKAGYVNGTSVTITVTDAKGVGTSKSNWDLDVNPQYYTLRNTTDYGKLVPGTAPNDHLPYEFTSTRKGKRKNKFARKKIEGDETSFHIRKPQGEGKWAARVRAVDSSGNISIHAAAVPAADEVPGGDLIDALDAFDVAGNDSPHGRVNCTGRVYGYTITPYDDGSYSLWPDDIIHYIVEVYGTNSDELKDEAWFGSNRDNFVAKEIIDHKEADVNSDGELTLRISSSRIIPDSNDLTREWDYFQFRIRAIDSNGRKSEWRASDSHYINAKTGNRKP